MVKNLFTSIAFIFFISSSLNVIGQSKPINVVTTAVPFLRISPDARAGGMGDVGLATPADANSVFSNQSKILFTESKYGIGATYTPWLRGLDFKDIYLASVAGYIKLDETQAITSSFRYFNLGNIQFTDENGDNLNNYHAKEYSLDLGYTRKLGSNLALGVALRYIHSNLASGAYNGQSYKAGTSVAADLSLFHDGTHGSISRSGLNWGLKLSNLGSKISYTDNADDKNFIPANLGIGIAYVKVFDETNKITFGLDLNKLLVPTPPQIGSNGATNASDSVAIRDYKNKGVVSSWFNSFGSETIRETQVSLGVEYTFENIFSLRTGYFYESPTKGDRKYFTFGAGLNYSSFNVNFSYLVPNANSFSINPLENTLRAGIIFKFK